MPLVNDDDRGAETVPDDELAASWESWEGVNDTARGTGCGDDSTAPEPA